ncbi:ribonucleoside-diphosphate reductase, adenosylcobalamin-dependent [Rubrivirga sp. SAORIC476]|uniref:vitamin B12-dependent ribonucleotide reductase n=1 Tax=Rubrivirga sp. SAORIC476 TaxID=1961794 RepID=UPI000BA8F6C1|nr:vitamin B12-dependent ribonucleotide reductase [Rubrivirga sp. SAORIC476]MBC11672.1 ribonucleoside-diphosphate reductase, adenosylcobalamin-dependent [Rhodothermaceae bacterium]PAP80800.1 ribonucleoside-diphosphate reductase, adenosylcobalamin-dependent [Rubrivirga sp. SAORIC476]
MAKKKAPATSGGLTIDRVFSTEGQHPFDSVSWTTRDAAIKNFSGEAIFEQKGVEFPEAFSPLAVNVVASKYFYGDVETGNGTPAEGQREYSLKQLVHRVTRTITDWGREQNYFATDTDAETFYDDLTWLCTNQFGAFNSPVWFNVGLGQQYGIRDSGGKTISGWDFETQQIVDVDPYERPQASACFIISVEDSVDDIWQLMGESARLFKFGSGVGADWSKLRSSHEKLSGGGIPSGPVSFMKVQDATGGTIKSGGKTRRAAIMQTLKVWHPDILEFVRAKQTEERKAWALIEEGYDGSFNGDAYGSVAFQNVNQSVRLNDAFMEAANKGERFGLTAVTSGEVVDEVDAQDLLLTIAEGTHICGDPGAQYEDTIQRWHTCKNHGPIHSSNPCSEYMFLDDSACNLASLNLMKFKTADGRFDVERYRAASRLFITAQEILVDNAGYPSATIAKNSHTYRPLGLGFANLGALLMSMGLPYDSEEGRAVAAALMAIEHCEAYARSAEIAANPAIGPFDGYADNAEPMLDVMRMHRDAVKEIDASCPAYLTEAAQASADRMVTLGEQYGYRNAQATVLAPTGTIGFMMDCDTTGIEPDLALVKYKLLAGKGDGLMKIVNQTVPEALSRLGYSDAEVAEIIRYIDENDTIEGAPGLKDAHLPVFDCAFKPHNGERYISHMGHIRMMAACQPFISGAISKTVNLPESATIEDIADAYTKSWELGLKAVAIYRENSKRSQPLSTQSGGNTAGKTETAEAELASPSLSGAAGDGASGDGAAHGTPEISERIVETIVEKVVYRPHRERLPDERPSVTHKFSVAGHEGYLHVGLYPEGHRNAGRPGEIFITMAKQGSTIAGLMDSFATAISLAFQYGVPLEDLVSKFGHVRFEPAGFTNNPKIPIAKSITDYIFRYLSLKFLGGGDGAEADLAEEEVSVDPTVAVASEADRHGPAEDQSQADLFATAQAAVDGTQASHLGGSVEAVLEADANGQLGAFQNQDDSPACPNCGGITVRAGSCYSCPNCGSSTGCG